MYEKALNLTKKLVSIDSRNATPGEKKIGEFLYDYIGSFPYFQKHPKQLLKVPLPNDPLGRFSVLALLIGEKDDNPDTIMLHGHTDTVDVTDYGNLAPYAFDCDRLMEELMKIKDTLAEPVRRDLESGNYLFGRGASDMKGGDAVHICVLEQLSQHPGQLSGNILLSLNPVEETLHAGIISALDTIEKLKEEYGLNYIFAINNDFITEMYPGDTTRYVYTGSVGKMLPCFYIRGKETHVGQAFNGFDPNFVISELVSELNLNTEYCDGYDGEYPAPPVTLKAEDLKKSYSVQTPVAGFCYFNYMIHNKSTLEILEELKGVAQKALDRVAARIDSRYQEYCKLVHIDYQPIEQTTQVLEYRQIYDMAQKEYDGDVQALVDRVTSESIAAGDDKRITSLKVVEALTDLANIKIPTIVVFFATPYCPHNTMKKEIPEEAALTAEIQEILNAYSEKSGEKFEIMHFFPSLTDSSYIRIDDDDASIKALYENFPSQDALYPLNYDQMKRLNIPGLNYGTFGIDAHKWTERVNMDYSFGKLPGLILDTIMHYLG